MRLSERSGFPDAQQKTPWLSRLIPGLRNKLSVLFPATTLAFVAANTSCYTPFSANHCANNNGDPYCEAKHDGNEDGPKPYCLKSFVGDCDEYAMESGNNFDGCVAKIPPSECHADCGGLQSLPDDFNCLDTDTNTDGVGEESDGVMTSTTINESADESSGGFCGDNVQNMGESCDGDDLNGEDCVTLGHSGGTLACAEDCSFNPSDCTDEGAGTTVGLGETGEAKGDTSTGGILPAGM